LKGINDRAKAFNKKRSLRPSRITMLERAGKFDDPVVRTANNASRVQRALFAHQSRLMGRKMPLGHLGDCRECGRVAHGKIGQHLPVNRNPGATEPLDQPAIRQPVLPSGGVDPHNPQAPEIALASAPVSIGVPQRAHQRLMRPLVQAAVG